MRIVIGFILGVIFCVLIFVVTPIGNRYFLKSNDGSLYKIDTWTGETWWKRYWEEADEEGHRIKFWHWSKVEDSEEASAHLFEFRGSAKKIEAEKAVEEIKMKQEEEIQQQKENEVAIAKMKEKVDTAKKIHSQCGDDENCIINKCDKAYAEPFECYQFAKVFLSKSIFKRCKDTQCIKNYCKDKYGYYYPSEIDKCANSIIKNASIEIK